MVCFVLRMRLTGPRLRGDKEGRMGEDLIWDRIRRGRLPGRRGDRRGGSTAFKSDPPNRSMIATSVFISVSFQSVLRY